MAKETEQTMELVIDGTLDLHTFAPSEVTALVPEYLALCAARGIREVRIVHGKGTGALAATVKTVLTGSPLVASFRVADESAGGWGATLVALNPSVVSSG